MNGPTALSADLGFDDIQQEYFNGFSVSIGSGDVAIVLMRNNHPTLLLQTSYTLAKTLAEALNTTISKLEDATGNTIMTTHFIGERLIQSKGDNDETRFE